MYRHPMDHVISISAGAKQFALRQSKNRPVLPPLSQSDSSTEVKSPLPMVRVSGCVRSCCVKSSGEAFGLSVLSCTMQKVLSVICQGRDSEIKGCTK